MKKFRDLPLHRKLTVIVILTTVVAMLLSSIAIVSYQVITFTQFMVTELETTADVLGANGAAALRFEVPRDAEKTLSSLKAKPYIQGACFFNTEEKVFAVYTRDGDDPPMPKIPLEEGYAFTRNYIISVNHIHHDGDFIGSVHIVSDLEILYDQIIQSIIVTFLIITACSFLAFLLSLKLLRVVSRPITTLINTANQVSKNKDYSLRVEKYANDDLGNLTEEFNDMLRQIQLRDKELEKRVNERTTELSQANTLLQEEIAEHKLTMEERIKLEKQLGQSQKMEAVGQLTAGIAHNFNNMLQGIMGNIQLSLMDAPESIKPMLRDADASSIRAAEMIQQLMLYSRQSTTQLNQNVVDINNVINNTIDICRKTFDRKIDIALEQRDILTVQGESIQLQQIFLNLCLNARDALEESSQPEPVIRIEVNAVSTDVLNRPSEIRAGSYAQIKISDNGKGMDKETQAHIFDPFFTTKEIGKGTGLGLATVFGMVRQHQGWIECKSEPGIGTTFFVYLPVSKQDDAVEEKEGDKEIPRGTETILIIDDEELVRSTTTGILEHCGYTVLKAEDGKEGLAVFRSEQGKIDLILLDLSMPKMSGQEVLAEIRAIDTEVKIVLFTGYAKDKDIPLGSEDIIQKPFAIDALARKVREVLDK